MAKSTRKTDTNIKPFWQYLGEQLAGVNPSGLLELIFNGRGDLSCRVTVVAGLPSVLGDDGLRQAARRVDIETVRSQLVLPADRQILESVHENINGDFGPFTPNTVATAIHGPLFSPTRTTQRYSVNVSYSFAVIELQLLLGKRWAERLSGDSARVSIREAARAAQDAGLLEVRDDESSEQELEYFEPGTDLVDSDDEQLENKGKLEPLESVDLQRNEIWFGPPGTGKSHGVQMRLKALAIEPGRIRRITFHPETSYFDLVGSYRPTVQWVEDLQRQGVREPRTYYDFVPGPLAELLVQSAISPSKWHALVIEEINRGNCAAIFGDFFQLLDRTQQDVEGNPPRGYSEYEITPSPEFALWLSEQLKDVPCGDFAVYDKGRRTIRLPPRLLLLATMNTADQSLFPMDTAFKRRWEMRYVPIDANHGPKCFVPLYRGDSRGIAWRRFFPAINRSIVAYTRSDDKQMGPWFIGNPGSLMSPDSFCSKVLHYLWIDVFRGNPSVLFHEEIHSYDDLVGRFNGDQPVFNAEVLSSLKVPEAVTASQPDLAVPEELSPDGREDIS